MTEPNENVPDAYALVRARFRQGLEPWQEYLFDCFPEAGHRLTPPYVADIPGIWRVKDWPHLASDTVACNGTQMAAKLSMAYRPKVIVEMGVHDGTTTLLLCKLNPGARVYGVDCRSRIHGDDSPQSVPVGFTAMMQCVNNLTLHIGNSWDFAMPGRVDLCFIDACHTGDAPWRDTLRAWENRNAGGEWCIAWDDYHPNNPDVVRAVDRMVAMSGMDLHQVGSWFYIGTLPHDALKQFERGTQ
jgi:hypothetical protein